MAIENYLDHPTLGLLFGICLVEDDRELYTTLYAQRLFFLVSSRAEGYEFEPISRSDARMVVENRLRVLRRSGQREAYSQLQAIHKRTFQ